MKYNFIHYLFLLLLLQSCIGDDIVQDRVEPTIRIVNALDSLAINSTYQFEFSYLNNVGTAEVVDADWSSSDPSVISITSMGLAEASQAGSADISVSYNDGTSTFSDVITVHVGTMTVLSTNENRSGTVNTTSSYELSGSFVLEKNDTDELVLRFSDDYVASTALPGLYVYLTNNPNTTEQALEIGAVTVFSGAHEYNLGTNVGLMDYGYVLYFCKPFNVKVGDGLIE